MKNSVSYHKAALRCFRQSFFPALFLCLRQVLLWLAFSCGAAAAINRLGMSALLFLIPLLILLLVYRFFITHRLVMRFSPETLPLKSFFRLIPAALWRMSTVSLWAVPFAAGIYRLYQYIFILPATTFTSEFTKIGTLITPKAPPSTQLFLGTILFFSFLIASFAFCLYGWRRGVCFDVSQTTNLTLKQSLKKARSIRTRTRKSRFTNTILHVLILLPAIVVPLILPMSQLYPLLTGKAMNDIQLIFVYLSAGIVSDNTLYLSAAIFLVLYLPCLPFRKLHNIAAVVTDHD